MIYSTMPTVFLRDGGAVALLQCHDQVVNHPNVQKGAVQGGEGFFDADDPTETGGTTPNI